MDEVLDVNLMEESFDDPAVVDGEESEEDQLREAGMHVEGEEEEEVAPLEPETE